MKKLDKEFFKTILPENPVVLDVGCYDGADGLEIFDMMGGELHCFDPCSYDVLKGHGKTGVFFYPCVLWVDNGHVMFHPSPDHPQSGSIPKPLRHMEVWPDITFGERIRVRAFKLDTFWPKNKLIDLIWCDVNGSEGGFLKGAKETLKHTKYIYIEYSENELYEGQVKKRSILYFLQGWSVIEDLKGPNYGNLLLRNDNLQCLAAG